jgi:Flp pilus assembly protein TadG
MRVMKPLSWRMRLSLQSAAIWRDRCGVSAVEFAMLVPILILMYVGTVEIGNLLTLMRRVETVASTAADLSAQKRDVSNADLADIVAASTSILSPYDTTPLKVVVSSVVADQNNSGKVAWSCSNSGSGRAAGSPYALPTGTTVPNSSVIVAEVTYAFTPLLNLETVFSPGALDLKRTIYARPRRSLTVSKTNTGCPPS